MRCAGGEIVDGDAAGDQGEGSSWDADITRFGATAVGVDATHVYLFGGETSSGVQATASRYAIATNSWEAIAAMPVAVRNAVAVLNQNRVYVTGGVGTSGVMDTMH